ncbi:MAG: tail fiber domain-containing protein [Candidatus Paceibacterota bacterium]|jgi:hypothetical protein
MNHTNSYIKVAQITVVAIGLFAFAGTIYAWTGPTSAPPSGNVDAPINVSNTFQSKDGNLMVNAAGTFATGFSVPFGNVGIGTAVPGSMLTISSLSGVDPQISLIRPTASEGATIKYTTGSTMDWLAGTRGIGNSNFNLYSFGTNSDVLTVLKASGNVGIGIASPTNKLDVNGTVNAASFSIANGNFVVGPVSGTYRVWTRDTTPLSFLVNNAEVMTITDGKVGIGTMSPAYKLDVAGDVNVTGCFKVNGTCIAASGSTLSLAGGTMNASSVIGFGGDTTYGVKNVDLYIDTLNTGVTGDPLEINYRVSGPVKICASVNCATYSAIFNTDKSVSLGGELNVNGGVNAQSFNADGGNLVIGPMGDGTDRIWTRNANVLTFFVNNGEVMRVADGKVGIGIASPAYKLDVAGDVNVTGCFKVNGTCITSGGGTIGGSGTVGYVPRYTPNGTTLGNSTITSDGSSSTANGNFFVTGNSLLTGNVGIGTASPSESLDVYGNAKAIKLDHPTTSSYNQIIFAEGGASRGYVSYIGTAFAGGRQNTLELSSVAGVDMTFSPNNTEVMRIASGGFVGIGTNNPAYKLQVNGDIQATSFLYPSDASLKTNIQTLPNALDNVLKLRGVEFNWLKDGTPSVGVIAQEVEQVYPDLVSTNPSTGLKSVQYGNLVGPLIEAVKAQQKEIEDLKARIKALEQK